jgi:hypothetical protein
MGLRARALLRHLAERFSLKAGALHDTVEFSVWDSAITIGNRGFGGVVGPEVGIRIDFGTLASFHFLSAAYKVGTGFSVASLAYTYAPKFNHGRPIRVSTRVAWTACSLDTTKPGG